MLQLRLRDMLSVSRYIKGAIFAILLIAGVATTSAQVFQEGEVLYYRAAYRAKLVPNIEAGEVTVSTRPWICTV